MNTPRIIAALVCCFFILTGLVVRHDVDDSKFIELGKKYPQVCHFAMGEGTLVGEKWILTAGHIGFDLRSELRNKKIPVVNCNGKNYEVEMVIVHPSYRSLAQGLSNDVAMIKLKEPVTSVTPVAIYKENNEKGREIVLAGSGDIGNGQTGPMKYDRIMRAATNRVDSVDRHWISFVFDEPGSSNVTALEGISGPGDSGGPAFIQEGDSLFVAGISSYQTGQDQFGKGHYGVREFYARASAYREWINITMHYNSMPSPSSEELIAASIKESMKQYAGNYGFRKIIVEDGLIYFQRENEPKIPMTSIGKDLFLWDDQSTKLFFTRDSGNNINGLRIMRQNGEIVDVLKDK